MTRTPSPRHTLAAALYSMESRELPGHIMPTVLRPSQQSLPRPDGVKIATVKFQGKKVEEAGVITPIVRGTGETGRSEKPGFSTDSIFTASAPDRINRSINTGGGCFGGLMG